MTTPIAKLLWDLVVAPDHLLAHGRASGSAAIAWTCDRRHPNGTTLDSLSHRPADPFPILLQKLVFWNIESKKVVLDTLHRAATDTNQDAWSVNAEHFDAFFQRRH